MIKIKCYHCKKDMYHDDKMTILWNVAKKRDVFVCADCEKAIKKRRKNSEYTMSSDGS